MESLKGRGEIEITVVWNCVEIVYVMRQIDLYKEKEVEEKLKRNTWFLKIEGVYSIKDLHGEFLCDC
jgi:hypothetical protein